MTPLSPIGVSSCFRSRLHNLLGIGFCLLFFSLLLSSSFLLVQANCDSCCNSGDCESAWNSSPGQCCRPSGLTPFCCPSGTSCSNNANQCDNKNVYSLALPIWAIVCIAVIPCLISCILSILCWQLEWCCCGPDYYGTRHETIFIKERQRNVVAAPPNNTVIYNQPPQQQTLGQAYTTTTTTAA